MGQYNLIRACATPGQKSVHICCALTRQNRMMEFGGVGLLIKGKQGFLLFTHANTSKINWHIVNIIPCCQSPRQMQLPFNAWGDLPGRSVSTTCGPRAEIQRRNLGCSAAVWLRSIMKGMEITSFTSVTDVRTHK